MVHSPRRPVSFDQNFSIYDLPREESRRHLIEPVPCLTCYALPTVISYEIVHMSSQPWQLGDFFQLTSLTLLLAVDYGVEGIPQFLGMTQSSLLLAHISEENIEQNIVLLRK